MTQSALERYTHAFNAMMDHQELHGEIFAQQKKLFLALVDAENDLRDIAAEEAVGAENTQFKVTVSPQTQTWADIEELDKAIASGAKLDAELRATIVKTQARPPRINITNKGSR